MVFRFDEKSCGIPNKNIWWERFPKGGRTTSIDIRNMSRGDTVMDIKQKPRYRWIACSEPRHRRFFQCEFPDFPLDLKRSYLG